MSTTTSHTAATVAPARATVAPARATATAPSVAPTAREGTRRAGRDALVADLGLLAVRATAGLVLAGHGAQKLFGWWGGPGFDFMVESLGAAGYAPPRLFALLLGGAELLGGLLLALGLLTPLASAAVVGVMASAVGVHWPSGVWAQNGGYELPLLFGVVALAVGLAGPGRLALDSLALDRPALDRPALDRLRPWVTGGALSGLVVLGGGLGGAALVQVLKAGLVKLLQVG